MDVISTAEVAAWERFAFWREVNSTLWAPYDLRCDPALEDGFRAQVSVSEFGPVRVTLLTTAPHSIHRTPKHIRQADPEVLKLGCIVRAAACWCKTATGGGRSRGSGAVRPIAPPLLGPVRIERSSAPRAAAAVPALVVAIACPGPAAAEHRSYPGGRGIGALSSQFLLYRAGQLHEFSPSAATRLTTLTHGG
ncbi:hypothetical protein ACWDA3_51475 [Nonomuraea rubra]